MTLAASFRLPEARSGSLIVPGSTRRMARQTAAMTPMPVIQCGTGSYSVCGIGLPHADAAAIQLRSSCAPLTALRSISASEQREQRGEIDLAAPAPETSDPIPRLIRPSIFAFAARSNFVPWPRCIRLHGGAPLMMYSRVSGAIASSSADIGGSQCDSPPDDTSATRAMPDQLRIDTPTALPNSAHRFSEGRGAPLLLIMIGTIGVASERIDRCVRLNVTMIDAHVERDRRIEATRHHAINDRLAEIGRARQRALRVSRTSPDESTRSMPIQNCGSTS